MNSKQRRKAYRALPAIGSTVSVYGERVRVVKHPPKDRPFYLVVGDDWDHWYRVPLSQVSRA